MASPLVSGWLYATVPIDGPQGESGTGFHVFRKIAEDQGRVFLVTNKHVVCRDAAARPNVPHVVCHFNTKEADGSLRKSLGQVRRKDADGSTRSVSIPNRTPTCTRSKSLT